MSATALAEYLVLRPGRQEDVLHNCKYSRPPIITANGDAVRALRTYNRDPRRSQETLLRVKDALTIRSEARDTKPKTRDEALRCIEIIELFERNENALGLRNLALSEPPAFEPIEIEGVTLSITPDFIVGGGLGARARVGAGILRVAKAPDPADGKRPETRAKKGELRREMARYMVAMLQILLDGQNGVLGAVDRDLCFVADLRLAERIGPAPDHTVRLRDIRGACKQIAQLWPAIRPRPSLLQRP